MGKIAIVAAERADAPLIGRAVAMALGNEICHTIAGQNDISSVAQFFTLLAAREDTQHSYRNTLKAVDAEGNAMGFIVGYDGSLLHPLREPFYAEAKRMFGRDLREIVGEECTPDEFYLDSLAVFPAYRGRGIAGALIEAMTGRAEQCDKPLGLLCEKSNATARRLYTSLGFRKVGEVFFGHEPLDHLQK